MDRLIEAIAAKENPSVIGLDPRPELIPEQLLMDEGQSQPSPVLYAAQLASAYYSFNKAIIDAVVDLVPAVKPQIAMYEALGPLGMDVYVLTCRYAQEQGLQVIGDIKRGDIGSTAAAYAKHLTGSNVVRGQEPLSGDELDNCAWGPGLWYEDAITVNPYLGSDGIRPFAQAAEEGDKDIFVLVRTSNAGELQELELAQGGRAFEAVGDMVEDWGSESIGEHGYSRVGAVVGATHPSEGAALRARMPHSFFLVPGYGAQGGKAADVAGMFDAQGSGAIVNSSRGVIGAWRQDPNYQEDMGHEETLDLVGRNARRAAMAMRDDLRAALRA
ncbi:orotidine-5'-phosphate decarboxylase [Bifidobacterium aemilianum]|uniref:Orotidine 5'-phosphate decarboxylase n=1 Tax=Bifidobacterium aemilianum TaxID=2493120 RepID=A0A366KBG7_9BIFI|nr:orotidine-5'-phosphate decarboxylase [Bifidobacterium aemilianum]RBP98001.1 orotidine-5'-phosphate decarboxylase [Bifidobacterium aemilianum]